MSVNSDDSTEARPSKLQRVRVRTGCLTCRARKVKCDERAERCYNCECMLLACQWPPGRVEAANTAAAERPQVRTPAHRPPACRNCRNARCKCSQTRPSCTRCAKQGISCEYPPAKRRGTLTPAAKARVEMRLGKSLKGDPAGEASTATPTDSINVSTTPIAALATTPTTTATVTAGLLTPVSTSVPLFNNGEHFQKFAFPQLPRAESSVSGLHAYAEPFQEQFVSPTSASQLQPSGSSMSPSNPSPLTSIPSSSLAASTLPPHPSAPPSVDVVSAVSPPVPSGELLDRHIDAYYSCVYPIQSNGFIHRGTLKQDIHEGRASEQLIFAICAVSSRFVTRGAAEPEGTELAQQWAQAATLRLMMARRLSVDNVMTAVILAKNALYSGIYARSFTLAALAVRQALKLGLHRESVDPNLTWLQRETRRRVMWACYCLDRMSSSGEPEFTICSADNMRIQLPCEEYNYKLDIRQEGPIPVLEAREEASAGKYESIGIMGHFIRGVGIRYAVQRYTRHVAEEWATPPWDPNSAFQTCLLKLADWKASIPPRLQLSRDAIFKRSGTNALAPLIMSYLWYDMMHCELYRLALPGYTEVADQAVMAQAPAAWLETSRELCVRHARGITQTLCLVDEMLPRSDFAITDHTLPMLVYTSMRIQVQFAALMNPLGAGPEIDGMRAGFEVMMSFVQRCVQYFHPGRLLLKEMKRMLRQYGMLIVPETESCGGETPPHPWFRRLKRIESEATMTTGSVPVTASSLPIAPHLHSNYQQPPPVDPLQSIFSDLIPLEGLLDLPDWLRMSDTEWKGAQPIFTLPEGDTSSMTNLSSFWSGYTDLNGDVGGLGGGSASGRLNGVDTGGDREVYHHSMGGEQQQHGYHPELWSTN